MREIRPLARVGQRIGCAARMRDATWFIIAIAISLCSCRPGSRPSPTWLNNHDARASEIRVTTERFVFVASAWVTLYVRMATETNTFDEHDLDRLRACETDTCAMRALSDSIFATRFAAILPTYLRGEWPHDEAQSRAAIDRIGPIVKNESALADRFAKVLEFSWDDPVRIDVVVNNAEIEIDPRIFNVDGRCFHDDAISECALVAAAKSYEEVSLVRHKIENVDEWREVVRHAARAVVASMLGSRSK
jgi:hypothetical protein